MKTTTTSYDRFNRPLNQQQQYHTPFQISIREINRHWWIHPFLTPPTTEWVHLCIYKLGDFSNQHSRPEDFTYEARCLSDFYILINQHLFNHGTGFSLILMIYTFHTPSAVHLQF